MKKMPHLNYRTYFGQYYTQESWVYKRDINGAFERLDIAAGYATDGASIPRLFWWLFSPFDPRYMEEATIHDYLCDKGQYKRADLWFEQLLIDNDEIVMLHRKVFIASIKKWHWLAYQDADYFKQAQPRFWLRIVNKWV